MQPKEWQSRTTALVGLDAMERLAQSRVLVFGAGGVGGYIVEALARGGVGAIGVVDGDVFAPSNLNRQIIATQGTLGQPKAEIAARRIKEINPEIGRAHV